MRFLSHAFLLLTLGLIAISCYAFEGGATSKDGNLKISYTVEEGYKIFVQIDTKRKKAAYQATEQSDVNSIDVAFIDVNKDGYLDVLIQHADETGYTPEVLVNHGDSSFTKAMLDVKNKFKIAFYVNTEVDLLEEGELPGVSYQLKDMNGDGVPELVFYNAFIDNKGYRFVAFQFNKKTMSYHLYKKGKLFLDQNE